MPLRLAQRLLVLLCLLALYMAPAQAQSTTYSVYLPLLLKPPQNISGGWVGVATQAGAIFDYQLSLIDTGQAIQGTATVSDGKVYARMSLTGAKFGTQYLLDASAIVETNGAPLGTRWCIPSLLLSYVEANEAQLRGTWKQDGCNQGRVYLQRADALIVNVEGTWGGTATQAANTFSYTLNLGQNGSRLSGIATTSNGTITGTMRLKGVVVGADVIVQETELLQSNGSAWCYKTVEAKHSSVNAALSLAGDWSAVSCIAGKVTLYKR